MIKPTAAQQTAIDKGRYKHFVRFTLEGSTLTLGEGEIWEGGFEVSQAVSGQSAFELGACVVNQLKVEIYNPSGRYQTTDFMGKPVYAYIELYDTNMTTVIGTISKGHYIVDEANTNGGVIKLTCLDMMTMLDTPYSEVTTAYPATLYNIANGIAQKFGLTLTLDGNTWLPTGISSAYTVANRPTEDVTCRDVLSAVCQATANYATIDRLGNLFITRYDVDFISDDTGDYSNFDYHDVTPATLFSFKRDEAQVVISGVSVEVEDAAYTAGTDDYMLHIKDNPMINAGSEQTFATAINGVVNGWNFRPFEADIITNMCMEAGDNILLTDTLGNIYKSVITNTEYSARENQRVECNAESAAVNSSTRYSQAARSAAKLVKNYDSTVNNYIDLVSKGLGMYRSLITDPDDPTQQIYAFHNEETIGDSTFCMFENSNGIQVGRRDTTSDPWVYTSASVEDAVVLAQTLVANTAIIDALFSNDVTVTGALHSSDYVPASPGASPPYAQAGMGLDFGDKEFEGENFAIDATGKLYAHGAEFTGSEITGGRITLTDDGGVNPNLRIYNQNSEDYGTVIGSVSWLKEWYDPDDPAHWYYYAWRFRNGEMIGAVVDDVMRMRINWQKGTIEATGDISTALGNLYVGYNADIDEDLTVQGYMNGKLKTPNTAGYAMDVYGNLKHSRSTNTDTWEIMNNAGTGVFKVNYETGDVTGKVAHANNDYCGVYGFAQNNSNLIYFTGTPSSPSPNAGTKYWFVVRSDGINVWNATAGSGVWSLNLPVTVGQGGTGATTAANARNNLGIKAEALWSGGLSTVNQQITFTWGGYNTYIIGGTAGGNYYTTVIIPANDLRTSQAKYLLSDEAVWVGFGIWYSGSTGYVKLLAKSGNGSIAHVWGIN